MECIDWCLGVVDEGLHAALSADDTAERASDLSACSSDAVDGACMAMKVW